MRGKLNEQQAESGGLPRFNEARALCAGSFVKPPYRDSGHLASMRPAHYAREVRRRGGVPKGDRPASMRPAHYAREVAGSTTAAPSEMLLQ